jgi:hypothetical protein
MTGKPGVSVEVIVVDLLQEARNNTIIIITRLKQDPW